MLQRHWDRSRFRNETFALAKRKTAINNSLPDAIATLTHIGSVNNLRGNGQSFAAFIVNACLYVRAKVPRALLKGILDENDANTAWCGYRDMIRLIVP